MPEAVDRRVELLGESVCFEARRSGDATEPRIDVGMDGIVVVLPEGSTADPETLLTENAAWVLDKRDKYDSYRDQAPERCFERGEQFPYLGESYPIVVERRPSSAVENGAFRLAAHHVEQTSIRRALEALYRREARETFERRAERYATEMGVSYGRIEIRNQRTKWGSCSTNGTLELNWRLMMAPSDVVTFVVVHELAHLREPNHGDSFWSLVAEHDPEYVAHAEWLDEHSADLVFSDEDL
jgi:hypothetical protein